MLRLLTSIKSWAGGLKTLLPFLFLLAPVVLTSPDETKVQLSFLGALLGIASKLAGPILSLIGGGSAANKGPTETLKQFFGEGGIEQLGTQGVQLMNQILTEMGIPISQQARDFLVDFIGGGSMSQASQDFLGTLEQTFPEIRNEITNFATGLDSVPPEILNQVNTQISQGNYLFDRGTDINQTGGFSPQLSQTFDRALDFGTGLGQQGQGQLEDFGIRTLEQGGASQQSRLLLDLANEARVRSGDTRIDQVLNAAAGIISEGGSTPESRRLLAQANAIVDQGGATPETRALLGAMNQIISQGGMTPEIRQALGSITSQIQAGGLTPEARQLLADLQPIIDSRGRGGALLGFDEATSFAGSQAALAAQGQREALIGRAQQTAAPGTAVASGLQGQAANRLLQGEFEARRAAVQQAALQQQALQLQQFQNTAETMAGIVRTGQGLVGQLTGAQAGLLGVASNNLSNAIRGNIGAQDLEAQRLLGAIQGANQTLSTDVARFGAAGNAFGQAMGARTALLGLAGQFAGQSGGLQQDLLGLGVNAINSVNNQRLGGLTLAGNLAGQAQGFNLDSLNFALGASANNQAALNSLLNLRQQNIGLGLGLGGLNLDLLGLQGGFLQNADQRSLKAILGLGNLGLNLTKQGTGMFGNLTGLLDQTQPSPGFFGNPVNMNAIASLIGILPGLFGSGGSGGSTNGGFTTNFPTNGSLGLPNPFGGGGGTTNSPFTFAQPQ